MSTRLCWEVVRPHRTAKPPQGATRKFLVGWNCSQPGKNTDIPLKSKTAHLEIPISEPQMPIYEWAPQVLVERRNQNNQLTNPPMWKSHKDDSQILIFVIIYLKVFSPQSHPCSGSSLARNKTGFMTGYYCSINCTFTQQSGEILANTGYVFCLHLATYPQSWQILFTSIYFSPLTTPSWIPAWIPGDETERGQLGDG